MEQLTRRNIIKAAALGTTATGLSVAAAAYAEEPSTFEKGAGWDAEYDVVVCGYGCAGASAAITAAENGARVLILEKAPRIFAGGNSRFGQNFMAHTDVETVVEYMKAQRDGLDAILDEDCIRMLAEGFTKTYDWFVAHGVPEDQITFAYRPEQPELWPGDDPQADGFRKITWRPDMRFNPQDVNASYQMVTAAVRELRDSIDVWYDAPATRLVQDPETKVVHGVVATVDGTECKVRAKNGVVLATGGFENNEEMIQSFTGNVALAAKGCTYNTGDGIVMAQEVGAQLWHLDHGAWGDPNFLNPYTGCAWGWSAASGDVTPPNGWYGTMGMTSSIIVGGDGTRFMNEAANETRNSRHGQTLFHGTWTHMPFPHNSWMIWDEQARSGGFRPYNSFSENLDEEIAKGWIVCADTLQELGELIGIDGSAIATSIERYNGMCEKGTDDDWGRQDTCLVAFSGEGPYYALPLVNSVTNTDGGAKRNARCEVLNARNEPIPHLYSAGSFGSFWVGRYNGGGNMGENLVTGWQAGANAAAPKDDSVQESCLTGEAVNYAFDYVEPEFACEENQSIGRYAGMNGTIAVRVTFDGDVLANIEVLEANETPGVGTRALEALPALMVEGNTTLVDTFGGATRTSAGLILAVEAAMRAHGIEPQVSEESKETVH